MSLFQSRAQDDVVDGNEHQLYDVSDEPNHQESQCACLQNLHVLYTSWVSHSLHLWLSLSAYAKGRACHRHTALTLSVGLGTLVEEDHAVVGEFLELLHSVLVLVLSSLSLAHSIYYFIYYDLIIENSFGLIS